jgi:hypothetical protein
MRWRLLFISIIINIAIAIAQDRDSLYIRNFPYKMWVKAYIPSKYIEIYEEDNRFSPNYPFMAGIGIGLHKIRYVNLSFAISLFPLKNESGLRSYITDIQIHSYGKKSLFDAYYQSYKGFFVEKETKNEQKQYGLFPALSLRQAGIEYTHIFNHRRFSARAAFEQSEQQIRSAGSFLLGGGIYWHRVKPDTNMSARYSKSEFDNIQIGINAGYAYSWVISRKLLLSSIATIGLSIGNETQALRQGKVRVYPTAMVKASFVYSFKTDWSLAVSGVFNNKTIYTSTNQRLFVYSPTMQLTLTKHFDFDPWVYIKKTHKQKAEKK